MDMKSTQILEFFNTRISNIEKSLERLEKMIEFSIALQRNNFISDTKEQSKISQGQLLAKPYNDLSPEVASKVYKSKDITFILLDVSSREFKPKNRIPNSLNIPLEELERRYPEINSKTTPLLIISEKGLRSIQACELLLRKGFLNLNNVSGGHQFWPENKVEKAPTP